MRGSTARCDILALGWGKPGSAVDSDNDHSAILGLGSGWVRITPHWCPLLQFLCWSSLLLRFPWNRLDGIFHMACMPRSMGTRCPLLETTLYGSGSYVADNFFSFCLISRSLSPSEKSDFIALLFAPSARVC